MLKQANVPTLFYALSGVVIHSYLFNYLFIYLFIIILSMETKYFTLYIMVFKD